MVGVDGPEQLAHCSFCGKSQKAVGKLVAGPERGLDGARAAYICNECVALCAEIIAEEGLDAGPPARPSDAPPG